MKARFFSRFKLPSLVSQKGFIGDILGDYIGYFVALIVVAVVAYLALGFAVDIAAPRIPPEMEQQIFGQMSMAKSGTQPDSRIEKLKPVLSQLVANPEVPKLNYRVGFLDEKAPNAVAVPGGEICVTKGLLDALEEKTALAFVLGHELGHFKNRDHLRGLGRAIGVRIILGYILGDNYFTQLIGGSAIHLLDRKYSRTQEESADRFGLLLVYKTYGTTQGTTKLFEMLSKNEAGAPGWAYMLSTHPRSAERVADLKKYAEELEREYPREKAPAEQGGWK